MSLLLAIDQQQMQVEHDSYRYINWVLFTLAAAINSIPTQAFSGVSPIITQKYEVSELEANLPSFIFPISYIFILIPSNYILDKHGLKLGTLICEVCMILGLLLRLLINVNFYLFVAGTFVCSLGFCFMISGANKFATIWFPQHQIFLVSSICVLAIFSSDAIGSVLSSILIRKESSQDDVLHFFIWESGIMITINVLMALFFRGHPKHMQNYASTVKRNPFKQDLKALVSNKNYLILFLSTSFVFCSVSIVYVFVSWITKTYGFDSVYNGYIIISANCGGIAGCVLIGTLAKSATYKRRSNVLAFLEIIAMGMLWGAFELGSPPLACVCAAIFGSACYPLLTTLTDFATQTTFPVGEASSSGILLFGGQFAGVIFSVFFSFIFDGQSLSMTRILNGILIVLLFGGFVSTLFTKQILRREEYENRQVKSSLLKDESLNPEEPDAEGISY